MSFRFRKSIKIAPGIRINLSKSGISTSVGPRGAKVNFSKRGTRVTTGIPGTGLSASRLYKKQVKNAQSPLGTRAEWATAMFLGFLISGVIAYISSSSRTLMIIASIAFLVVFLLILRKPRPSYSQTSSTPVPTPPSRPLSTSTWQERVEAIETSRTEPQQSLFSSSSMINNSLNLADHLGDAADARGKAKAAEQSGDFDLAWKYLHEEKHHFLLHASRQKFSFENTLALDASVSERMANILRKQKRHNDAFQHIAYWVSSQRGKPIQRHNEKFRAYYNRADKMNVSLEEGWSIIMSAPIMDLSKIQLMVSQWLQPADHPVTTPTVELEK